MNLSPKRTRLALLLSVTLPLAACESLTAISGQADTLPAEVDPAKVACEAFKPISWADADTDQTIREVKAHNAVYEALCPTNP